MMELNIEIQPLKGEKTATTTFLKVKEKKSALSERQAKKKKNNRWNKSDYPDNSFSGRREENKKKGEKRDCRHIN